MNSSKKAKNPLDDATPSTASVSGTPTDVWEQLNKYGRCEVQDTTDTENLFPQIGPVASAGIQPKKAKKTPSSTKEA